MQLHCEAGDTAHEAEQRRVPSPAQARDQHRDGEHEQQRDHRQPRRSAVAWYLQGLMDVPGCGPRVGSDRQRRDQPVEHPVMRRPAVLTRAQNQRKRRERATDNDRRHTDADRLIERTRGRGRPDPVDERNHGAGGDEGIQEPQPGSTHGHDQHQRFEGAPGKARPRRDDRGDPGADHEEPGDAEALLDAGRVQALGDGEPLGGERGEESRDEQGGLVAEAAEYRGSARPRRVPARRARCVRAGQCCASRRYARPRRRAIPQRPVWTPPRASVPPRATDANGSSWSGFPEASAQLPQRGRRGAHDDQHETERRGHAVQTR